MVDGACRLRRREPLGLSGGGLGLRVPPARVLAFLAGGCAGLAVLFATTAAASAPGWSRQLATKPASKDSVLTAVSCTSRKACAAVGYFKNKSGRSFALVERWNGVRWSIGRTLQVRGRVSSVECRARRRLLVPLSVRRLRSMRRGRRGSASGAVGWFKLVDRGDQGFCVRTRFGGGLSEVSCAWRAICAASGIRAYRRALLGHWNGRAWSWVTFGTGHSASSAVSCVSATACEGVGEWETGSGDEPDPPATWDWNGKGWSEFDFNQQSAELEAAFYAVSCLARDTCIEVGGGVPSAMSFDGSAWSPTPAVSPSGAVSYGFIGVSCRSLLTAPRPGLSNWRIPLQGLRSVGGLGRLLVDDPTDGNAGQAQRRFVRFCKRLRREGAP